MSKVNNKSLPKALSEPLFIGDHPVLDMLNTVSLSESGVIDFWRGDQELLTWLTRVGVLQPEFKKTTQDGQLVAAARDLREIVRTLVQQRKNGLHGKPTALNAFMAKAPSANVLLWESPDQLQMGILRRQDTAEEILAPLAEASAEFLALADFALVRICEADECALWFYDRTKSHKRRWCSMALCGNRHKVSEYRKRISGAQTAR
ncbi:MAG: CGNR zinc finger domain-containing protein [Candidatus Obscuribacterales bacterium]|nr:CGNR zinc finger domain-containing protein [Candidatus Obscuribacterales bacterium]